MGKGSLGRSLELFLAGPWPAIQDVFSQGAGKQNRLLGHQPHVAPQPLQRQMPHVQAVQEHLSRIHPVNFHPNQT